MTPATRVAARFAGLNNLKPGERVTVYHGTLPMHARTLLNGFDANTVTRRVYTSTGNRHKGLFVSPNLATAQHFSNRGYVLEIVVQAKNLHGTNYGGNIGREQNRDPSTREWQEWLQEKYPDSFRPYLSSTLLQTSEPQALLRGLVKPSQIKRVRADGKWYSRKDFLELGAEVHNPNGPGKPIRDFGFDMSSPRHSLSEFFQAMAAAMGMSPERVESSMLRRAGMPAPRGERAAKDLIERAGFGQTAAASFLEKLMDFVGDTASPARVARKYASEK